MFTGHRAEYGLLVPILRAVRDAGDLDLALFVGSAHGETALGRTLDEIEADGFPVAAEVDVRMAGDDPSATSRAIGGGVLSATKALTRVRPDVFVVYGDRFEAFAALIAATQMRLPTVHIEGGDLTEGGALDDTVRHAMTKLAHLHLTTNADAAARVRAMGEEDWRVHMIGFPPIDLIRAGDYAPPEEVAERLDLDLSRPVIVFTQHSISTEPERAAGQVRPSLTALGRAMETLGAQVVATYPNNDAGGAAIVAELEAWAEGQPGVRLRQSLGRHLYHGALNVAGRVTRGACVGNSSSGLKETAAFGCPTVDIGSRQRGRLAGGNVVRTEHDADAIYAVLERAITDTGWRADLAAAENPYGTGDAGPATARILREMPLGRDLIVKRTILP